jgi:hypothetical protein
MRAFRQKHLVGIDCHCVDVRIHAFSFCQSQCEIQVVCNGTVVGITLFLFDFLHIILTLRIGGAYTCAFGALLFISSLLLP